VTVPLHSHEFYSNRIGTVGPTNLYTVPSGFLIVVKHVHLFNPTATVHQPIISVDGTWILAAPNLGGISSSTNSFELETWIALAAGRVLKYSCASSANTDVNISGYLYPLTL
jgi:hypothetical protein